MRATIVGAGIGGLALAGLLRREGWQVTVRERATALPESGTTLGMWPEAMAVLDDLGVGDRVRDHGVHQRGGRILTAGGRQLAGIDTADGAWLINRPELVAALASVAGPVEFGAAVPDWQSAAGRTDLLVGADGVHSVVRAALGPAVPRRPGITIWRGRASVASTEAVETWAPGHLFGSPRDRRAIPTGWTPTGSPP